VSNLIEAQSPLRRALGIDARIGDAGVNSAETIVVLNSEVSVLSPVSSPGVLDEPEHLSLIVSDQEDSVVRSTVGAGRRITGDDSSAVREQEISVHGDSQRSVVGQIGHDLSLVSGESSPVGNLGNDGLASLAGLIDSLVGIVSLVSESSVVDDILVSQPWESTIASSVAEIGFGLEAAL